jgi:hypothetical protein
MKKARAEFQALKDDPSVLPIPQAVSAVATEGVYTIQGMPASADSRGVVIANSKKVLRR